MPYELSRDSSGWIASDVGSRYIPSRIRGQLFLEGKDPKRDRHLAPRSRRETSHRKRTPTGPDSPACPCRRERNPRSQGTVSQEEWVVTDAIGEDLFRGLGALGPVTLANLPTRVQSHGWVVPFSAEP